MKKKANKSGLSRIAINFIIILLIVIIGGVIFILVRNIMSNQGEQDVFDDSTLDLKISQVQKVNDNTLDVTVKRNEGMGEFVALSFAVDDGALMEIVRINSSMPENQDGNFSLNFVLLNASKIKRISVTPIFIDKNGKEVIGNVKDEYVTPNVCSTYCPSGAQCGFNDCGIKCGNGCSNGYLCLNYKCIKEQSSGGGGGSGSSSSSTTTCTDTCASLVKQCGTHTICGESVNCGTCSIGYVCNLGLCIEESTCTDTCSSLGHNCGTVCGVNCGTCSTGYSCIANGTCMKESTDCIPSSCSVLGKNCGTVSNGCSGTLNCGTCSTGYTCQNNICIKNDEIEDINIQQINSDCGDILDYQCGTRTICDKSVSFGNCPSGYNCNNNLCIASNTLSCSGVTCPSGEYCSNGVCLLDVSGETYFVATWGDNNNLGTFAQPWRTWQKAVIESRPGDITYIRGGIWQPNSIENGIWDHTEDRELGMEISGPESYNTAVSGTKESPIRYFNYPGEKPIMDGQFMITLPGGWNYGISIENAEYIYLRGLTVRHIHQSPPDFSGEYSREYSEVYGIGSVGANIYYEKMVSHDIDGRGFQHTSSGKHELGEPEHATIDNTSWINCDAYNLYDRYSSTPGNRADGWLFHGGNDNNYYLEGCRAFNYSDDGFNADGQSHAYFKSCWAMSTDKYKGLSEDWDIEGNGYKISGITLSKHPDYSLGGENFVRVENSIAANCVSAGIVNNIEVNHYPDEWPNNGLIYNNFAYKNTYAFWDYGSKAGYNRSTVFRNNIAYASTDCTPDKTDCYEVGIYYPSVYPNSNNTWVSTNLIGDDSWPGWEYNPLYSTTDDDFVSLDTSQLMKPRKSDGSLPDVTFGHLAEGSDLIDGGMIIPGYHCSTAGVHPGQNCVEWYGLAPDLGTFESNY